MRSLTGFSIWCSSICTNIQHSCTQHAENFHWSLNFAVFLMANSINLYSGNYQIFLQIFSTRAQRNDFNNSNFADIQIRDIVYFKPADYSSSRVFEIYNIFNYIFEGEGKKKIKKKKKNILCKKKKKKKKKKIKVYK